MENYLMDNFSGLKNHTGKLLSYFGRNISELFAKDYICRPGELAQLVERLHGMQEVSGSNPLFSTRSRNNGIFYLQELLHYSFLLSIFVKHFLQRNAYKKYVVSPAVSCKSPGSF